jgi:hypothetical protein
MAFPLYLLTESSYSVYLLTQELQKKAAYFFTPDYKARYIFSQDLKYIGKYLFTPNFNSKYIFTKELSFFSKYFFTPSSKSKYFFTKDLDANPEDNICIYPKELEKLRNKAILLYFNEVIKSLRNSIYKEGYGRVCEGGYNRTGMLRILLDYLSSIWLERDTDSRSGLARVSDYYYTKYSINDIIVNFRKCDINIKPIIALFNLNSYSIIDNDWNNYYLITNIINPPTEEVVKTLKQFTDIFTTEFINVDANQRQYPISNSQYIFPVTKSIKYLTSFSINGNDYTAFTDYNLSSVTYSQSTLFGYTITSSDTVTITYWYEE